MRGRQGLLRAAHREYLSEMAGSDAALLQIFLVILFGAVELSCGGDFRRKGPPEFAAGFQSVASLLRNRFLLRRVKENRGAVLSAEIRTLPVHLRGIVDLPKHIQELLVTYLCRVKRHLHYLGMAGFIRTNKIGRASCRERVEITVRE